MSRIPLVEPESAPPEVKEVYRQAASWGVPLLNVLKMFGNHAEVASGFAQMVSALYAHPKIAPRYRELAYLRASQLNSCHY